MTMRTSSSAPDFYPARFSGKPDRQAGVLSLQEEGGDYRPAPAETVDAAAIAEPAPSGLSAAVVQSASAATGTCPGDVTSIDRGQPATGPDDRLERMARFARRPVSLQFALAFGALCFLAGWLIAR
jgi:hypothetical protein